MEDSGIQRGIWDGDAKAVQQCLTDIFTSVYTTCDIPENAIFGPCILSHTSLYDSIAFIALKSTDKRTVPYIFRVDTSAANGSSEGADKLLAPRPGGPLPGRLEGGSPARGSAFTSVPQLGGAGGNGAGGGAGAGASGGAGGGQGAASDERKSAFSQPARSFSQLSPLVLGQKLSALEPCHPGDGVGPTRLYPAASDPLAVKLQGAADLNGGCGALPSGGGGGLPKQNPFLYATAFWPKSSAAAAAAAAAAAGPLQLQLPSALTLLPPSFTSLCLPAQNWCAKCNASFRMTSDLVYHMRSHHKKEYAMEPLVKRRREEKLKCPICNESFRERHHLSRHMTSHN
ncbi:pr domain zinc finger protein 8 [Lynx pardinus]|uniref:Pr domain zinc finger protein 8 n=1 Tax=Lynx pardinus TaxID=191816 RepID=A0A485NWC6_LYNPA|nr:pr domain zinc finger protein 8 [Lynx pardinus]